jgi:SMODS-associated and fused to various effectors sensor domain
VERGLAGQPLSLAELRTFWQEWQHEKTEPRAQPSHEALREEGLILVAIGGESIRSAVEASVEALGLENAPVLVDFSAPEYVEPAEGEWEAEAKRIRNQVKAFVDDPRFSRLHLFYRGPVVLAPLLGALIARAKTLVVYYYQDGRYRPAYTLDRRLLISKQ